MNHRTALAPCFAVAALLTTACSGSSDVIRSAQPNPMSCKTSFVVLPIHYERVRVGRVSETEYLQEKSGDQRQSWDSDKEAINQEFRRHLIAASTAHVDSSAEPGEQGRYTIRPTVRALEPGFFIGPAMHTSQVMMTVAIETEDGRTVDLIELENQTLGSVAYPTTRSRFEHDGKKLGGSLAEYLNGRLGAAGCAQNTARR